MAVIKAGAKLQLQPLQRQSLPEFLQLQQLRNNKEEKMLARVALRTVARAGQATRQNAACFSRKISTEGLSAPIGGYEEAKRPKLFIPGKG